MNPRQPGRRRPAVAMVAAAVLALAVGACQSAGTGNPDLTDPSPETTAPTSRAGEQTYRARCYVCHGEDLTGTASGPSLAELRDTYGETGARARIQMVIEEGVAVNSEYPAMPPIIGLSEKDIDQLAVYILEESADSG